MHYNGVFFIYRNMLEPTFLLFHFVNCFFFQAVVFYCCCCANCQSTPGVACDASIYNNPPDFFYTPCLCFSSLSHKSLPTKLADIN